MQPDYCTFFARKLELRRLLYRFKGGKESFAVFSLVTLREREFNRGV